MASVFASADARWRADGSYGRLHALAERLLARFAPDPGRTAEVTASAPACLRT